MSEPPAEMPKEQPPTPVVPPPAPQPETTGSGLPRYPAGQPLGYAGRSRVKGGGPQQDPDFVPMTDRWRLGFPDWDRYYGDTLGAPYQRGRGYNPYRQNVLKGDYPLIGQDKFLVLDFINDTLLLGRGVPTPSNISSARPGEFTFFGANEQMIVDHTYFLSAELFQGDTSFKPKDWAVKLTPAFNVNTLFTQETGIVNVDVRQGVSRVNGHIGFQEAFGEVKLTDVSPNYDFASFRGGIQPFNTDFRGFLFVDSQPGARFFGNAKSNRYEYNVAYFRPLEKDTYSRLNTIFEDRRQDIVVANLFKQDFVRPGFTQQLTLAFNNDKPSVHFDNNGVQVRPALIGDAKAHAVNVGYLGFNGSGHFDRWNVTYAAYQALGRDTHNGIAGRGVDVNAQMVAAEVSYDIDWMRYRGSIFFASGDSNPRDGEATGFDAIFDAPAFAGGDFSFWNSQGLRFGNTAVNLVSENSLLPSLRSSKLEGQANFVNPGIFIVNAGADFEVTPRLKVVTNFNYLRFMDTETLELVLNQGDIQHEIGYDFGLGLKFRPLLNDNVVAFLGTTALVPGAGFRDIFFDRTLFSAFGRVALAF